MTRLAAACLSVLLLALVAVPSAQAYTVMKTRPYTWWSLADNDHLSVAPPEFMNPLSGYVQPGVPQYPGQPVPGAIYGPGMYGGPSPLPHQYHPMPGHYSPQRSLWR
jgi:hypothetical protein